VLVVSLQTRPRVRTALVPALLALLLVMLCPKGDAHAEPVRPVRAHLIWLHPPASQCPSAEVLEREVEALTGRPLFVPLAQADVVVRGGAQDGSGSARAWFSARRADGTLVGDRELFAEPGQCAALTGSLALVLSILLDAPSDEVVHPATLDSRLGGGVFVGMQTGTLPRVAAGLGPVLTLALLPQLGLRADASYWASGQHDDGASVAARWSLFSGGLALCPRWRDAWSGQAGRLVLQGCVGGQLGSLAARAHGLDGPDRRARLLAQLALELGGSLGVARRLRVGLSAGTAFSLTRPPFFYDRLGGGTSDLHRPAALTVFARITLTIGAP
jgi:hypothetical protein